MKKSLFAACAFLAAPALAQTPPMAMPPAAGMRAEMMNRVQLRAEVVARTQKMFAMLDVNHDGALDQAELAAAGKRWDGPREAGSGMASGRMPMDRNAMFDMMDTNHDGMISRDEFARAPMHHGDMAGGQGERMHGMGGGMGKGGMRMGGGMAKMWTMADINHDGRVTLQEATTMALQHFDRLDTNHDGQLTPDERAAGRVMMHGQ